MALLSRRRFRGSTVKMIEEFSDPLARYEGSLAIDFPDGGRETGYFEAVQARDGAVAIACFFDGLVMLPENEAGVTVSGTDSRGWRLAAIPPLSVGQDTHGGSAESPMTMALIRPSRLAVSATGEALEHSTVRIAFANLLYSRPLPAGPLPVQVEAARLQIDLFPVRDYVERAQRLRLRPGTEHTVNVDLSHLDGKVFTIAEIMEPIERLVYAFRLGTANKLDWLHVTGFSGEISNASEIVHKEPILGSSSNLFKALNWWIEYDDLIRALIEYNGELFSIEDIKMCIDYFVTAGSNSTYLQVRGLAASAFLDTLSLKYAQQVGRADIWSRKRYSRVIQAPLIERLAQIELTPEERTHFENMLISGFRSSFDTRLRLLNEQLQLKLSEACITQIKRTRNALVHSGRFYSDARDQWFLEYANLIWVSWIAMLRLVGYRGAVPELGTINNQMD